MSKGSSPRVALVEPAMETLLARSKDSLWPLDTLNDPGLILQTDMRQSLLSKLDAIFQRMPDPTMEIAAAVASGTVRPKAIAELYDLLAMFLDADPHHRRLVLYLSFELVPPKDWRPGPDTLNASMDRFVRSYMKCWRELLEETDVRANFFDGNILEKVLAPNGQPLVRKAAHLIPQLVRKGLVSVAEMTALMNDTVNDILKNSIADALMALTPTTAKVVREVKKEFGRDWLKNLPEEIAFELKKLDMREALDHSRNLPYLRVAWERRNNEDVLVGVYAKRIADAIHAERTAWETALVFVSPVYSTVVRLAVMRGLRTAVENLTKKDRGKAIDIVDTFINYMQVPWLRTPEIRDELESVLCYLVYLGVASETHLQKFGFELPKLDASFSKTGPLAADIRDFTDVIGLIAREPEYSRLLYPVAIFFGSRLKGYAKRNADLDAAIFVRPETSEKERATIRDILAKYFQAKKIDGKVVEFWLEAEGKGLKVRDFPDPDVFLADSTWVHLLLGSVWLGTKDALKELYKKMLPGFLHSMDQTFMGRDLRKLRLDELERDILQYRLMHKGYRRFFPSMGGIDAGVVELDPESTFWDSGYRRLATKLFVSRVFLPELKK